MYDPSNSSVSTTSADDQYTTSSAPTTPDGSSMNKNQSPDLLQTEFFNSDNLKDHARNLRMSMIHSESMESFKFQQYTEKETGIAMTNSPSFSALASILEKKATKYKPSPLHDSKNVSSDTIIPIKEESPIIEQHLPRMPSLPSDAQSELASPNLIQLDDIDTPFYNKDETSNLQKDPQDDIFKTPEIKHSESFTQYKSMLSSVEEDVGMVPEMIATPEPAELEVFTTTAAATPSNTKVNTEKKLPEIKYTSTPQESPRELPEQKTVPPQPVNKNLTSPSLLASPRYAQRSASLPVLPQQEKEKQKQKLQKPAQQKPQPQPLQQQQQQPQELPKKKGFFSFLKNNKKRAVSSSFIEPAKTQPIVQSPPKISSSKSFTLESSSKPNVAKRSTSTNSLFSAFKRKSKVIQISDDEGDVSNITSETVKVNNSPSKKASEEGNQQKHNTIQEQDYDDDEDDDLSEENFEDEFQEDFNKLSIKKRPNSQISQNGETVFPKSLNLQEVESIVSIERSRSTRSVRRNSSNQAQNQPNLLQVLSDDQQGEYSLSDAISYNAREEGMSVEYGYGTSTPDTNRSPTQSVLKKTSITSLNKYLDEDDYEDEEELFKVEEFVSRALEYDDGNYSYNADSGVKGQDEDEEEVDDVSNLLEFAEYIDFGGDMELNFDYASEKGSPLASQPLNPLTSQYNQAYQGVSSPTAQPLQSLQFNNASPILASSPALSSLKSGSPLASPLSSPFLQQTAYIPNQTLARPISMSFRGLKAPVFENPNHAHKGSILSDELSLISYQSSTNINKKDLVKKVSFSSKITLYDVHNGEDYDRHPDIATCNQLTPALAQQIRAELNQLKSEMSIHEDSRRYTHFL